MTKAINTYYCAEARKVFEQLVPEFERSDNFWRLGHSFDTIIDFFTIDPDGSREFGKTARCKYEHTSGSWWDDYGWWTIAMLKASQHKELFADPKSFHDYALDNWNTFHGHAPNIWAIAQQLPGNPYKDYEPRFAGGVWNNVWSDCCNPAYECRKNPGNVDSLCGAQNTVTNGLYLISAARLWESDRSQLAYKAALNQEWGFLLEWIFKPEPKDALLDRREEDDAKLAFARERVSTFHNGVRDKFYRQTLAWTGDQGLFVGGMVDLRRVYRGSNESQPCLEIARQILAGTRRYLTQPDGTLWPWRAGTDNPPGKSPGDGQDQDDYWTGPAVFLRYLLYAFRNDKDLRGDILKPDYLRLIKANAEHAIAHPNDREQGSCDPLINLTNALAALVAAAVILPEEAPPGFVAQEAHRGSLPAHRGSLPAPGFVAGTSQAVCGTWIIGFRVGQNIVAMTDTHAGDTDGCTESAGSGQLAGWLRKWPPGQ